MYRQISKFFVAAFFVFSAMTAMGQSRFYHLEGDTVRGKSPIYFYDWWPTLDSTGLVADSASVLSYTNAYMRHFTPDTIKIIGIASTMSYLNYANPSNIYEDYDATLDTAMYYILFDDTPSGPVELARACWTDDYLTHPKRFMELPYTPGDLNFSCNKLYPTSVIAPLREYYFDSAIMVVGSFYLGWQRAYRMVSASDPNGFMILQYNMNHRAVYDMMDSYAIYSNEPCALVPEQQYIFPDGNNSSNWTYQYRKEYSLVFPIIEIDTMALMPCVEPEEPTISFHDRERVRVEWVDNNNHEWIVSVVSFGDSPENGQMYPTTSLFIDLAGLNPDSAYSVYVKGSCRADTWSGWSLPCTIDTLPGLVEGIEMVEGQRFTLRPNPASGMVTVATEGLQGTVAILDMQGRELLSVPTAGPETVVDVSSLAAGTYVVRVTTAEGFSTQKLTVR